MPFSKFEPDRPFEEEPEAKDPSARRRVLVLRWAQWVAAVYTAIGFGFMAYWLLR